MSNPPLRSWSDAFRVYAQPRVLGMLFLGFAAGLPFMLVGGTMNYWLRSVGVELAVIGFLSWFAIAHSIKVLWAPVVDRLPLAALTPWLGRRRAWIFVAQITVGLGLLILAASNPPEALWMVALGAAITAFGSATQDIAIDAYRVEAGPRDRQGAMAATYVAGYRVAILLSFTGAVFFQQHIGWAFTYGMMALLMGVGLATTLIIREPETTLDRTTQNLEKRVIEYLEKTTHIGFRRDFNAWFISAVVCPFADFFKRFGLVSLLVLAFIGTFRISDIFMGVMASPFYDDMGFSANQIAFVTGAFGLAVTLSGAALGGLLVARYGIMRLLIFTAFMAPATNLTFSWVATLGPETYGLVIAIVADNLTGGMAIAVLIAYMSSLTNTAYTATQFALFSSLMTLPGQFLGGFTGVVAEQVGWVWFFVSSAFIGIPAIALALVLARVANPDTIARPGMENGPGAGTRTD